LKKLDFLKLSILWIEFFLGCGAATARDISIFVATDLHVMSPELIVNEGAAWDEYLSITHKMEDYSVDLFQDMIDSILFEMPDIVLIPGDISKDGERVSHEYVSEELTRLTDVGIKVYVVPGNHDIGYIENGLYYDGDRVYQADSISPEEFVELYSAFGYEGSIRDENSLSYVAEPVDGLVILGIDSHTNRIEAEELDWICEQAKTAKDNGKQVLAMLHHPIMEHYNGQVDSKPNAILQNADSIRPYLIDAGYVRFSQAISTLLMLQWPTIRITLIQSTTSQRVRRSPIPCITAGFRSLKIFAR
jgi:predicted MPP superfamily phosphohydrolase